MIRSFWHDKQGKPISMEAASALLDDYAYRVVARTPMPNLGEGARVSTVWLGLNQGFGDGPPLIFETMVFGDEGWGCEIDVDRYATLEEAKAGHEAMVRKHGGGQ